MSYVITVSYEIWDDRVSNDIIDKMILSSNWSLPDDNLRQPAFHQREHRPRIKITGRND